MSAPRKPSGPIRQLSLQQPPRRQQIRRQRSADEEKPLQIYSNPIRSRFCASPKPDVDRPKIRIAWGEQRSKSSENQVEIVARQIPGKSRPPTARNLKNSRPSITEKPTILYSRQELAERLRLAWKQREENKSNIDIFLAHNTVEERCDSQLSTSTSVTTPPTPLPRPLDKRRQELQKVENTGPNIIAAFGNSKTNQSTLQVNENETQIEIKLNDSQVKIKNEEEETDNQLMVDDEQVVSFQKFGKSFFKFKEDSFKNSHYQASNQPSSNHQASSLQATNNQTFNHQGSNHQTSTFQTLNNESNDLKKTKVKETFFEESLSIEKKKSCINIDWSSSIEEVSVSKLSTSNKEDSSSVSSAKLKRAGFQSGLNKAFVGPIIEKTMTLKVADKVTTLNEPKFRRTSSAPPIRRPMSVSSNRTQISIVIDAPPIKNEFSDKAELKLHERKDAMTVVTSGNELPIKSAISHRPIKSAPIKRRAKSGKRRGLAIGSKDGDNDIQDRPRGSRGKTFFENRMTDIVTMVSLVSSADSDSDVDENSLRDDKLIHELRNKLPTTPIIKSSTNPAISNNRRPIKSVSFQQDSFDDDSPSKNAPIKEEKSIFLTRNILLSRGNSRSPTPEEATTWRTEVAKLVPPLPPLTQESETLNIPLTDREKRCLVVPISDLRDKKRKLLRTRSTPPKPSEMVMSERIESSLPSRNLQNENSQQSSIVLAESSVKVTVNNVTSTTEVTAATEISVEPPFQTAKEKECWHLYRRMCDKGVYVSFDTVLRGMLTPTEYRLRQKEMSQNC